MAEEQQTYQRAASTALLGLATQLGLAVVVAGLGLYAQSQALHAATWYLFGGLPIWLTLWMLYHQHRLERREALEAEQLSREDARAAALFDEAGHNLATARKRLEGFYKWGLNAVSVTVAVYLLSAGLALFFGNWGLVEQTYDGRDWRNLYAAVLGNGEANPWLLVGFTALLAFLGFLVARYVAGMTRVPAWQLLRGGAAYLIGNVLVLVLLLVATGMVAAGNIVGLAVLSLLIPLLMTVVGIETLLALVFGVYRPRKKDELVRPAFDSRLLGWLTRPESLGKIVSETLNYQFGFEITKSWFYVLLGRAVTPLLFAGAVILLGLSCVVIVAPNQQALVTDRGAFVRIADPGVSFKLPWPLGRAEKFDVKRSQQLVIGTYDQSQRVPGKAILWTNDHVAGEVNYFATAPTQINDEAARAPLLDAESYEDDRGRDAANQRSNSSLGGLISLQAIVTYNIADLGQYLGATGSAQTAADRPEQIFAAVAQRRLNALIAQQQIDNLIGAGRISASQTLLDDLREDMAGYGISVEDVLLYDIHPPKDNGVADAFLEQVNALQGQKTAVENAQRDAIGTLSSAAGSRGEALQIKEAIAKLSRLRESAAADGPGNDAAAKVLALQTQINRLIDRAGGEASRVLADARQERWRTALAEKAESSRFSFELAAYEKAPEYFKTRHYLDAVAEAFSQANRRVISTVPMGSDSTIRLNLEDAADAAEIFSSP